MRAAFPVLLRLVALVVAWSIAGAGASAAAETPDADDLITRAVRGTHEVGYRGTQTVLVWGQDGTDAAVLDVVAGRPGWIRIDVGKTARAPGWVLVQRGAERTVYGLDGGLLRSVHADLVATEELAEQVDLLLDKYTPVLEGTIRMLGRDAWRVGLFRASDRRLVERWTVDAATGVILEREGFDRRGLLERMVAFSNLEMPYDAPASAFPAPEDEDGPGTGRGVTGAGGVEDAGFPVPDTLPAGYRLRSDSRFEVDEARVVHLTYSDGLEPLSLFRQQGLLQPRSLPPGAVPKKLEHVNGYAWERFPRGLAWQDGGASFVLVGAASTDELVRIANSLPQGSMRRSIPERVANFFRWLHRSIASKL